MSTYQGSPVVRSKFTQHGCSCCQCWCLAWLTLSPVCDRQPAVMEPSSSAPPPGSSARRAGPSSILPASTAAGTSELSLGTPSPSGQTPVMKMKMMKMKVCPNTDLQIRKKSLFFFVFFCPVSRTLTCRALTAAPQTGCPSAATGVWTDSGCVAPPCLHPTSPPRTTSGSTSTPTAR